MIGRLLLRAWLVTGVTDAVFSSALPLVLIPLFTHRPPVINVRWWVQFAGHIPFVALPIVSLIGTARG